MDIVYEGRSLLAVRHSDGTVELQKGYDWTGEGQIFFKPASDTPFLEVEFNVAKEEYRGLMLKLTHAEDYGIFRVFIDEKQARRYDGDPAGQDVPDIDLYAPVLDVKEHYIGSFAFTPGKHTLRLEGVGRNPLSKGQALGLDSVRLRERWMKKRKLLG